MLAHQCMAGSYLEIAKYVLEARAKPLSAQEILADAQRYGLLPDRLSGATMQKTLQARISEDIFRHRKKSSFYRTSLGTYYLRYLADDQTLPSKLLGEHPTHTRRRPHTDQRGDVLYVSSEGFHSLQSRQERLEKLNSIDNQYAPIGRGNVGFLAVSTISILRWQGRLFTHIVGRYSQIYKSIGARVIGLKRHVDEFDVDLIEKDSGGIFLSSLRESGRIVPELERYIGDRSLIGIIESDTELSFVVLIDLRSEWSGKTRRRLDINRPEWRDAAKIRDIDDLLSRSTAELVRDR